MDAHHPDRRQFLAAGAASSLATTPGVAQPIGQALLAASQFPGLASGTYLNAAQKHPLSLQCLEALKRYTMAGAAFPDGGVTEAFGDVDVRAKAKFGAFINAEPAAIALTPGTQTAENLVLAALDLPRKGRNIVTDALHFDGSQYLYDGLNGAGFDIRRAAQRDGRIDYAELERLIDDGTALVAVSLVSFANGFQHDLPRLCRMAHAKGALVYADIFQAVGAVPIDVKASGVDFCASGTHKWLMGDKGIAFLYVRPGLAEEGRLSHRQYGRRQFSTGELMVFAPPDQQRAEYKPSPGARGLFEIGNQPVAAIVSVDRSMDQVTSLGVGPIGRHAAGLAEQLRATLPKIGYKCLSPADAPGQISAFLIPDQAEAERRLKAAKIQVRIIQNFMRVSVGTYNDVNDINALTRALSGASPVA